MPLNSNEHNSMGIVIKESSEGFDDSKISVASYFGDDQAFPFIPGFDKNFVRTDLHVV
tara:strand:- start:326 stop:499 length:174 start_codon:yes stop_codon:yes gene_type:complete